MARLFHGWHPAEIKAPVGNESDETLSFTVDVSARVGVRARDGSTTRDDVIPRR